MKKIFFVMAIMTVFTTVARDRLYIENFSIAQGETLTIPVQLDNDTAYCAFQTDLYLPQGMQVEVTLDDEYETYNIYLTSRKTPYHRISTALLPDGAIRIAVTAYPVFPFSGNSGPIATIELTATETLSNAVLTLHNSITVEESGQMHYLDDCEATVNAADVPVLVTGISLNKTQTTLYLNETETLIATITPADADNQVLNWTSSDPTVATVDQNGVVTALAVGTATITATTTDGSNLSASCAVTVRAYVSGISLNKTETELYLNETETLTATITPSNAYNQALTWTSSDPTVAAVDQNGVVTALAVGTATITATTTDGSNLSASCIVTVKQQSLQGDVNMDGNVNVMDVTAVINHILGNTPEVFNRDAADVNADGNINVMDVTAIINIILNS